MPRLHSRRGSASSRWLHASRGIGNGDNRALAPPAQAQGPFPVTRPPAGLHLAILRITATTPRETRRRRPNPPIDPNQGLERAGTSKLGASVGGAAAPRCNCRSAPYLSSRRPCGRSTKMRYPASGPTHLPQPALRTHAVTLESFCPARRASLRRGGPPRAPRRGEAVDSS